MNERTRLLRDLGVQFLYQLSQHEQISESTNESGCVTPITVQQLQTLFPAPYHLYIQRLSLPVLVVWTYFELDQDMRGTPDQERINLWNSIIKAKGWNIHDIVYWPIVLHDQSESEHHSSITNFYQFIERVHPKFILCFGYKAQMALQSSEKLNDIPSPTRLYFLPGADEMLPDNKKVKKVTWDLIRPLSL